MGWLDGVRRWWGAHPSESDLEGQISWAVDRRLGRADYLGIPAVGRGIELISSVAAQLPPVAYAGGFPMDDQPRILLRPNGQESIVDTMSQLFRSCVEDRNAFLWIPRTGRNASGYPDVMHVLPPGEVEVSWANQRTKIARRYHWQGDELVAGREIIHISIGRRAGELRAVSPLEQYDAALARILAAEIYAADWFDTGAIPSITLKYDGTLTDPEAKRVKEKWIADHADHSPAVLPKGWDTKESTGNPETSQLLETRREGVLEVGRILGIEPGELLLAVVAGSSLTYQNVAGMLDTLVRVTVQPLYLEPVEAALADLLPGTQAVRFDTSDLFRLAEAERITTEAAAIAAGIYTLPEVRRSHGLPDTSRPIVPPQLRPVPRPVEISA